MRFTLVTTALFAGVLLAPFAEGVCCSGCPSSRFSSFLCPSNANPFGLTCQNGQCQLPPACAENVCFSTKFNSQPVVSGNMVWLSAVFKPKFSSTLAGVRFTNSTVTISNVQISTAPPDAFIVMDSTQQTCGSAFLVSDEWQSIVPLPGSGNTFLSAVSIPVPSGTNYANAQVTWCGDINTPGEVDVQISTAVYTSCSNFLATPEACETHTDYQAGVPTGCLTNLIAGGTGGGGSNYQGSLSATYAICKSLKPSIVSSSSMNSCGSSIMFTRASHPTQMTTANPCFS